MEPRSLASLADIPAPEPQTLANLWERAAWRQRNAVLGREEGPISFLLSNYLPHALGSLASIPRQAMEAANPANIGGAYNPAPIMNAAMMAVGAPGTPEGALGAGMRRIGSTTIETSPKIPSAANANTSMKEILALPEMQPLSLPDRTWQNYASKLTNPDDVLKLDALWAWKPEQGIGPSEHFASLANEMWRRMGANRYITPELAKRYMNVERAKANGIGSVE